MEIEFLTEEDLASGEVDEDLLPSWARRFGHDDPIDHNGDSGDRVWRETSSVQPEGLTSATRKLSRSEMSRLLGLF